MYKLKHNSVTRLADGASIPFADGNTDYAEYLSWLAKGNTPLPCDPIPNPRLGQIKIELAMIDSKSIRAIRSNDTVRLAEYEAQATLLRDELLTLPAMVQP